MEEKAALRELIKLCKLNPQNPQDPKHLKVIAERRRTWKSGRATACQER